MHLHRILPLSLIIASASALFNSATADIPFRQHRFEAFKVLDEASDDDVVFIGNSITNMFNWEDAFDSPHVKNRGISGAFTGEILDNLESMIAGSPSKVFIKVGTNDIGTDGEDNHPVHVAARLIKILERIRRESPTTEIYYQSILPSQRDNRPPEKIKATNELVRRWIENRRDSMVHYIDLYSLMADAEGKLRGSDTAPSDSTLLSHDGLHLTQRGYKLWLDAIEPLVGRQHVIKEDLPNLWNKISASQGMRSTHFGALPMKSTDVLLIGDEMIHGGEWQELLRSADFKDRGVGWGFQSVPIKRLSAMFETILSGNSDKGVMKETPRAIMFSAGDYELRDSADAHPAAIEYIEAVESLRRLAPSTKVFAMTLAPLPSEGKYKGDNYVIFNEEVRRWAAGHSVPLIDVAKALSIGEPRDETYFPGKDSPYLSGLGYVKVAQAIAEALNATLGTTYEAITDEEALKNIQRFNERTAQAEAFTANDEFVVFDNKASEVPYRIPAIASLPGGDLIALVDYRYSGKDIGMAPDGKVDIRYRIYDAETGEWGEVETLAAAGDYDGVFTAFGDPCVAADSGSKQILVTTCSGNVSFPKGTHDNHQGWARFSSTDGGKTWDGPIDLAPAVFDMLDKRNDGPIRSFFIGSGKITQSRTIKNGDFYRLYCAALVKTGKGEHVNYVLYSDDFGRNWSLLGDVNDCPVPYGADEPKAEELPDGSVLVSSRIKGGRAFNVFNYTDVAAGTGKWGDMAVSNLSNNGVMASANACNGEILVIPVVDATGRETNLLLQSVPFGPEKRSHVGINYKELNADTYSPDAIATDWDGLFEISDTSSAYSTMCLDNRGNIAFLYEENAANNGYDIVYKNFSVEDITSGAYRYKK